ncbi:hypothetical protein APHAL10511_001870 [Amanita phalloides]|nr:hypothetical protein APHAL10511_001870 [Amanita phalloides]
MAHVLLLPLQAARRTDPLALRPALPRVLLRGFQLYAVEKWLVDRSRQTILLTVYTGLHHHVLPVAAYTPRHPNSWDNIISFLKRDGARLRQTEHGAIMVTSLAHFRSDYTILHIPDGDFPAVRDHLYANINLLRMNCSGRSALTLDEPSDSTKDRFISTYLIPDVSPPDSRTRDRNIFTATVLELVKLIQAGLSLFGMYSGPLDGLLCDTTVDGIRRWIADIGEPIVGLEPPECIADPMFVSALLSLVLSIRNKLSALGYGQHVPRDPFLQPQTLSNALAAFVQNTSPFAAPPSSNSSGNTPTSSLHGYVFPYLTHTHSFPSPSQPFHATLAPPPLIISPRIIVLNQPLIEAIDAAYESKHRPMEARKVRRAIKEKLDDLAGVVAGTVPDNASEQDTLDAVRRGNQSSLDFTTPNDRGGSANIVGSSGTLGGIASGLGLSGGISSFVDPTVYLSRFVKLVVGAPYGVGHNWTRGKGKSGKWRESADLGIQGYGKEKDKDKDAGSLRALWSGNIKLLLRMREWQELSGISTEKDQEPSGRWRDRLANGVVSEGEEDDRVRADGRTTEEESDQVALGSSFWSDRMQRTLESWSARRSRRRISTSLDLNRSPAKGTGGSKLAVVTQKIGTSTPTSVTQVPLMIPPTSPIVSDDDDFFLSSGQVSPQASNSFGGNSGFLQRSHTPRSPERLWTPTPRATANNRDDLSERGTSFKDAVDLPYTVCRDDTFVARRKNGLSSDRRRSFHDSGSLEDMTVLTPEQMRIDVELCGQMLVMVRRQEHLRNVISCLQVIESSLSATSSLLREDYEAHHEFIACLDSASVISDMNGKYKKADELSQQTNTLVYESKQFNIADLWQPVNHYRQQVFELRDKVLGTGGRRLPHGVHGAHGQFNRLQWTLDGKPQLVNVYGRTPKEVEEEARADPRGQFLPVTEEDEEDVVEHPSIKPMWLLRLFTRWGARWGAHATTVQTEQQQSVTNGQDSGASSALQPKTDSRFMRAKLPFAGKSPD